MASLNRVLIIGNLGNDPELRRTTSGTAVTTLRVATSHVTKDGEGQAKEATEWHSIVVWGRQAEACAAYLRKGRSVFVEGRLQTRVWDGLDGVKHYATEVVAHHVSFLGGRPSDSDHEKAADAAPVSGRDEILEPAQADASQAAARALRTTRRRPSAIPAAEIPF